MNGRMFDLKWSASEKKIARSACEHALETALANCMTEFKAWPASVSIPSAMWAVEDCLRQTRREFDEMFDCRYSRLPLIFARLIREGHLDEARLTCCQGEDLGGAPGAVSVVMSSTGASIVTSAAVARA